MPDGGVEKDRSIEQRLQYFFDKKAMADLIALMEVRKESIPKGQTIAETQKNILEAYAVSILQQLVPHLKAGQQAGLVDLDMPVDYEELKEKSFRAAQDTKDYIIEKKQERLAEYDEKMAQTTSGEDIEKLYEEMRLQMAKLADEVVQLEKETYEVFHGTALRIRRKLKQILEETIELELGSNQPKKIYVMDDKLGNGGIGTIYSCKMGDTNYALKLFNDEIETWENPMTYHLYENLPRVTNHPNLVKYHGFNNVDDQSNPKQLKGNRIDMMERLDGYKPMDKLRNVGSNQSELSAVINQVLLPSFQGVKALHDEGFVHADLKEQNIFYKEGENGQVEEVKVGDYDLLRESGYEPPMPNMIMGTISHMSPEQINGSELTTKSDIFSIGMILFYTVGGERRIPPAAHMVRAANGLEMSLSGMDIDDDLKQLILDCTKNRPEQRPDIDEVMKRLNDFRIKINLDQSEEITISSLELNVDDVREPTKGTKGERPPQLSAPNSIVVDENPDNPLPFADTILPFESSFGFEEEVNQDDIDTSLYKRDTKIKKADSDNGAHA